MSGVAQPVGGITLDFSGGELKCLPRDISACAITGNTLWLASDETAELVALDPVTTDAYASPRRFSLHDYFGESATPARKKSRSLQDRDEMDIEGLAAEGGYLWIVGSHTRTRKKPKGAGGEAIEALRRLRKVDRPSNRFFLGRVPFLQDHSGRCYLLARRDGGAPCGTLDFHREESALERWLGSDPHLQAFVGLPSKENGLDVEGLAVDGERIFLGLRGPVVRGYAVVLELRLSARKTGALKAWRVEGRRRYRKTFLDLDGLGIRSLMIDRRDLLLLAGPTMSVSGPSRIYRWRGGLDSRQGAVVEKPDIVPVITLPTGLGFDHPEAIEFMPGAPRRVLVVHDSPSAARIDGPRRMVKADLFDIEASGA